MWPACENLWLKNNPSSVIEFQYNLKKEPGFPAGSTALTLRDTERVTKLHE